MSNAFSGQILADKLLKLNNSQQSIENLSNWCIHHRKKAKQVVETWDKLFKSSQQEKRVSFLYLANDILQNSKRKGSEFVNEFWRVLPAAVKHVFENGDDNGKKAAFRLVDIWEERRVFGSRGQSLKDEMLGNDPPPVLESNGRSLNSIKIVKKDAHSIRIKLAIGGTPEKIVTAFQSVNDENFNEETALTKCKAAVDRVEEMEKDIGCASAQGNPPLLSLGEVQEQENVLRKCVEHLKSVEATRESLLGQLKEAVKDQESKLELIRTQLQVAQARIDQASNIRQRLGSAPVPSPSPPAITTLPMETSVVETSPPGFSLPPPLPQPVTTFATPTTAEEENKKAAAAVAAKLAASTSSAQMLSAVLSSLAAEEAASINNGLKSSVSMSMPIFPPEKRPRLETPAPVSDMSNTTYFANAHQQPSPNVLPTSNAQIQPPFPPPPPLPPVPPPPLHPYSQSNNVIAGAMPFRYGAPKGLPPPPPLPTHVLMGSQRPPGTPQSQQQQQQQQAQQQQQHQHQQQQQQQQQAPQQQQQQHAATGGYYQPHGMTFYGQNHQQPATPPVPRQ